MGSLNYHPYHYLTDETDVPLGESGLWIGVQTGAGGTDTVEVSPLLICIILGPKYSPQDPVLKYP